MAVALKRMQGVYSDNLIEMVHWCMALDPLARPQSVFALQKELNKAGDRRYTRLTVGDKVRMQIGSIVPGGRKAVDSPAKPGVKAR
jgi:hypothetical protein